MECASNYVRKKEGNKQTNKQRKRSLFMQHSRNNITQSIERERERERENLFAKIINNNIITQ